MFGRRCLFLLILVLGPLVRSQSVTNELEIARAALRDGLWNVARTHARHAGGNAGRLLELETYAQEGNWSGLLASIDAMGYPEGEGFSFYRATALYHRGAFGEASNVLSRVAITNGAFRCPAARLRAQLAQAGGDTARALSVLERDGGDETDTKLLKASLHALRAANGKSPQAERLWREVAGDTNASERARATAAVGLRDVSALRALLSAVRSVGIRRFVALKLGVELLAADATFAEGEKLIRSTVSDQPDTTGACEAFRKLAEVQFRRGDYAAAEKTCLDALSVWPEMAQDAALQMCYGRSGFKLGHTHKAYEAFKNAEKLATVVEERALAAVWAADAQAAEGQIAESLAAYQRILTAYPKTAAALRVAEVIRHREMEERARTLYRDCKFTEAAKLFGTLAKEDPERRERLAFYAVLCAYGAGDDDRAEREARRLAEGALDASVRSEAIRWLAKFAFNRGRWREAGELFRGYARRQPPAAEAAEALLWAARAALAAKDFPTVITTVSELIAHYPETTSCAAAMLVQGEALVELARFDEAVLVLDRAALAKGVTEAERRRARLLKADALFAMGADNSARYTAALEGYEALRTGEALSPGEELSIAFKIARTLEKLKRLDEAIDMYYTRVVLAYRTGRLAGTRYDEAARATFARAAFRLADEYESRGRVRQAIHVLELLRTSDDQASGEAAKRIERLARKGI